MELAEIVSKVLSHGYQVDPEAFVLLSKLPADVDGEVFVQRVIQRKSESSQDRLVRKMDLEGLLPADLVESNDTVPRSTEEIESRIEIVNDPTDGIAPVEAELGFKKLFEDRYLRLVEIAKRRPDFKGLMSLESFGKATEREKRKFAGLLSSRHSKKGGTEVMLDDPTGSVKVLCLDEAASSVSRVPLDSLVVFDGWKGRDGTIFASVVQLPDIPVRRATRSSHRVYALLLSDLHVGSRMFLENDFKRLLLWVSGKLGDIDLVSRIKYIVIAGDVIDGIGVYPGQEYQLAERDLRRQYLLAGNLIRQIPKEIEVLISPGNHDPVRQALPQPALPSDVAECLYAMENVRLLGNPCYVKLHGVGFLIYHGRSLDDIIATIPDLSYSRPARAMQVLLKSRHLAPIYGKRTALSPELQDMLVIDPVPDVLHCGHVHAIDTLEYRGTVLVNSGTWQAQTPFQANMGLEPTPSIVPVVDLSSMEVVKRNFGSESFS